MESASFSKKNDEEDWPMKRLLLSLLSLSILTFGVLPRAAADAELFQDRCLSGGSLALGLKAGAAYNERCTCRDAFGATGGIGYDRCDELKEEAQRDFEICTHGMGPRCSTFSIVEGGLSQEGMDGIPMGISSSLTDDSPCRLPMGGRYERIADLMAPAVVVSRSASDASLPRTCSLAAILERISESPESYRLHAPAQSCVTRDGRTSCSNVGAEDAFQANVVLFQPTISHARLTGRYRVRLEDARFGSAPEGMCRDIKHKPWTSVETTCYDDVTPADIVTAHHPHRASLTKPIRMTLNGNHDDPYAPEYQRVILAGYVPLWDQGTRSAEREAGGTTLFGEEQRPFAWSHALLRDAVPTDADVRNDHAAGGLGKIDNRPFAVDNWKSSGATILSPLNPEVQEGDYKVRLNVKMEGRDEALLEIGGTGVVVLRDLQIDLWRGALVRILPESDVRIVFNRVIVHIKDGAEVPAVVLDESGRDRLNVSFGEDIGMTPELERVGDMRAETVFQGAMPRVGYMATTGEVHVSEEALRLLRVYSDDDEELVAGERGAVLLGRGFPTKGQTLWIPQGSVRCERLDEHACLMEESVAGIIARRTSGAWKRIRFDRETRRVLLAIGEGAHRLSLLEETLSLFTTDGRIVEIVGEGSAGDEALPSCEHTALVPNEDFYRDIDDPDAIPHLTPGRCVCIESNACAVIEEGAWRCRTTMHRHEGIVRGPDGMCLQLDPVFRQGAVSFGGKASAVDAAETVNEEEMESDADTVVDGSLIEEWNDGITEIHSSDAGSESMTAGAGGGCSLSAAAGSSASSGFALMLIALSLLVPFRRRA